MKAHKDSVAPLTIGTWRSAKQLKLRGSILRLTEAGPLCVLLDCDAEYNRPRSPAKSLPPSGSSLLSAEQSISSQMLPCLHLGAGTSHTTTFEQNNQLGRIPVGHAGTGWHDSGPVTEATGLTPAHFQNYQALISEQVILICQSGKLQLFSK